MWVTCNQTYGICQEVYVHLYIHLSIYLCIHSYVYLSIHFHIIYLSIYLPFIHFQDPGVPNSNCSKDEPCPKDVILRTGNGNLIIII